MIANEATKFLQFFMDIKKVFEIKWITNAMLIPI